MGWRENMGTEIESNISIPKSNKSNKSNIRNVQENEIIKTNIADIADIALRVQKVKAPEIIIKKMSTCLHGSRCRFIFLVDDRQVCSRNNKAIFDMAVCPDGKWWKAKDVDSVEANTVQPVRCYCCGGQTFWREKDNTGARWICEVCHPPMPSRDEIEFLQ